MMNDDIKRYLSLTRGLNGFIEFYDNDILHLTQAYKTTLNTNSINVVIIKSRIAKTELVELGAQKYIIWDTSFFDNITNYIKHMLNIKNIVSTSTNSSYHYQKQLCQLDMHSLWNELFKSQLSHISYVSEKQQEVLEKYCSDNDNGSIHLLTNHRTQKLSDYIFFAKYYIFSHELAHVTYINEKPYLDQLFEAARDILNNSEFRPPHYDQMKEEYEKLNCNSSYYKLSSYHEIVADTRAIQTIWTSFIFKLFGEFKTTFSDQEMKRLFPLILEAQDGIDYVRSYLVRSTNLRHIISTLINDGLDDDVFKSFLIRDGFSQPINMLLLLGFDNNIGRGKEYLLMLEEYRSHRNIPIIDDLFSDEFKYHFVELKKRISCIEKSVENH